MQYPQTNPYQYLLSAELKLNEKNYCILFKQIL